MKKIVSLFLMLILVVSCAKKVKITGNIKNANPLERIEIVEAAGVGTLPLANIPVNSKGNFSAEFSAPKNGMYVLAYAGNINLVYLKGGQTLNISGDAMNFPSVFTITGDAKANNDFIKQMDTSFQKYASQINIEQLIAKKEADFIKDFQKIQSDLEKSLENDAKKYKADSEVLDYKKLETRATILGLLGVYEQNHALASGDFNYKPSAKLLEIKKEITKDNDKMVEQIPRYREYLLGTFNTDFQKFAQPKMEKNPDVSIAQLFIEFLKNKKEISAITKDYLSAYMIAQYEINPTKSKNYEQITKIIDENIQNSEIKNNLKELQKVLLGYPAGTQADLPMVKLDGSKTNLKNLNGKPTLVFFYASYNPNIALAVVPNLQEINKFYKSKVNFAFVNLDDTQAQFKKTSSALLKGFTGEHYFVEGGINGDTAKKFGLYAFKIPSVVILDKDGKFVGRPYFNLEDPDFVSEMNTISGLKKPQAQLFSPQLEIAPQEKK